VQNTEEVFLEWSAFDISHESIISIHEKLMKNIDVRVGYRTEHVRVFKSHFDSTPAPYVKTDMDLLLKWYAKYENELHPLVLACLFHHKFEKIHPFMDGNGRTGRMLLNLILLKKEFPPVIIETKLRSQYLDDLSKADKEDSESISVDNYSSLVQFVAKELITSYWNAFL
jgi:Fic family protein